jgi:hypothetical protein
MEVVRYFIGIYQMQNRREEGKNVGKKEMRTYLL